MKLPKGLLPQKAVAEDLCISLVTLWRARNSAIPGFPAPIIIRKMVFWKKDDLPRLEEALLQFEGRKHFEKQRRHSKQLALRKRTLKPKRRARGHDQRQQELF